MCRLRPRGAPAIGGPGRGGPTGPPPPGLPLPELPLTGLATVMPAGKSTTPDASQLGIAPGSLPVAPEPPAPGSFASLPPPAPPVPALPRSTGSGSLGSGVAVSALGAPQATRDETKPAKRHGATENVYRIAIFPRGHRQQWQGPVSTAPLQQSMLNDPHHSALSTCRCAALCAGERRNSGRRSSDELTTL